MICPEYLIEGLEVQFRRIENERMRDLPLLNPALHVQAVGFQQWNGFCLGVLITPWFMNLMLLPPEGDSWQGSSIGDKQLHQLPSGPYEFILGEEEGIGRYQMCSLFSPVFEFADQATAVATAEAAMDALMRAEHRDTVSTRESEIRQRWQGDADERAGERESREDEPRPVLRKPHQQPVSRRDLLRGEFGPHTDGDQ